MDHNRDTSSDDARPPFSALVLTGVWAALVLLTVEIVLMARADLGVVGPLAILLVASGKIALVAYFFTGHGPRLRVPPGLLVSAFVGLSIVVGGLLHASPAREGTLVAGLAPPLTGAVLAGADAAGGAGGGAAVDSGPASLEKADPARGKTLYNQTCIACHGPDAGGIRALNSPALHIQEDWYIAAQLEKFRSGVRGADPKDVTGMQMAPMAKALPDDQAMYDLAAYIPTIEGPAPAKEIHGADVAAGEAQYKAICIACHGPDGKGMVALKSPSLVGQSDWYIAAQLKKFKEGLRGVNPADVSGLTMRPMSLILPDEAAINNVAAYVASMPVE